MDPNQNTVLRPESGKGGSPPKAGRKEWIGLMVLALPTLLLSLDVTVLHLALPHLTEDLNPSSTQQLWILDIYGFMIAGFLVTMGTLGDRIGRRRLLMIGASAFGLASIAAAYSVNSEMLIVTRALLGIAGATLMPSTLSLISNMFLDAKQRTVAISVWMTCFAAGSVLGPTVGGIMLEYFWWGSVFLLGVPIMLLLLASAPFLLPEFRNPGGGKLDMFSVVLSLAAMLPFIYGVKEIAKYGVRADSVLLIIAGAVIGVLFVRRQRKLADPLMDIHLFNSRTFSASLAMLLLGLLTFGAFFLFFSQYLQMVKGLSPFHAGLWMLPCSAGSVVGTMLAPLIVRRYRPPYVIAAGLAIACAALLMLGFVKPETSFAYLITSSVFLTMGFGPMMVLMTDLVIGSAPPEKAGTASSLSETSSELGMALGVAALGSIGTAAYRSRVEVPAGLPDEMSAVIGDSLAGAAATARQLPDELRAQVMDSASRAFSGGFSAASIVSACIVVAIIILSVTLLRGLRTAGDENQQQAVKGET